MHVPLTWTINMMAAGRIAIGIPMRLIRDMETKAVCASRTLCGDDRTNVMKHNKATWWTKHNTQNLQITYTTFTALPYLTFRVDSCFITCLIRVARNPN